MDLFIDNLVSVMKYSINVNGVNRNRYSVQSIVTHSDTTDSKVFIFWIMNIFRLSQWFFFHTGEVDV